MPDYKKLKYIVRELDKVRCYPRLYPARVYALQLLIDEALDEEIDRVIIQPLMALTGYTGIKFNFRFIREVLFMPDERRLPSSWVEQFVSDMGVYGLREAIAYFHTYDFMSDDTEYIDNCIGLYHRIAGLYVQNRNNLQGSNDNTIKKLLLYIDLLGGDGSPQSIGDYS